MESFTLHKDNIPSQIGIEIEIGIDIEGEEDFIITDIINWLHKNNFDCLFSLFASFSPSFHI